MLSALPVDLTLTTNASALPKKAQALKDAGLTRITVSLDALDDADLQGDERRRLPGLRACSRGSRRRRPSGCRSRSTASSSAASTSTRSSSSPATSAAPASRSASSSTWTSARRTAGGWTTSSPPPRSSRMLDKEFGVEPVDPHYRGEVAKRWRYKDGSGEIGVIASVTQPFCGDCTRSRLSAEGKLYTCLFAVRGHDLRALIRERRERRGARRQAARDLARPRRPLLRAPRREHRRPCDRRAQGRDDATSAAIARGKPRFPPASPLSLRLWRARAASLVHVSAGTRLLLLKRRQSRHFSLRAAVRGPRCCPWYRLGK